MYPRARGADAEQAAVAKYVGGVSPRTGSRPDRVRPGAGPGRCIPAHGEQTVEQGWRRLWESVYPRARGADTRGVTLLHPVIGVSPRTGSRLFSASY